MKITAFSGIQNVQPLRSIADNALADAVNVDVTDAGDIIQRGGFSLAAPLTHASAAYFDHLGNGYVVADGFLCRIAADLSPVALAASSATAFCDWGNLLFTNDGLMLDNGLVTDLKALAPPTAAPLLSATTGDLPSGAYTALLTISNVENGKESGTSPLASLTLTETGGIIATAPDGLSHATVYLSNQTGTAYYSATDVQLNPVLINAQGFPPNVEQVEIFNSSLWCSVFLGNGQSALLWSVPKYWHVFHSERDYLIVPGQVLGLLRVNEGLLVGTDEAIYLLGGDDNGYTLNRLADYGVVAGRPMQRLPSGEGLIYSRRGFCQSPYQGASFQNLTLPLVSLPTGSVCCLALVYQGGMAQAVALNDGTGTAFNAANDTVVAIGAAPATVMNLNTQALTRYEHYPFLAIITVAGQYYGVMADGLYLLDGDSDNGEPILHYVVTKDWDFGTDQAKNVTAVYLNADTTTTVRPFVDGVAKAMAVAQFANRRVRLGRGNRGRYWRFWLGAFVKLQGIEMEPQLLQRQVN